MIECSWRTARGLTPPRVTDKLSGQTISARDQDLESFFITFDWSALRASELKMDDLPKTSAFEPNPDASRLSERLGGKALSMALASEDGNLHVDWRAELRDGSNYVRQIITFRATEKPVTLVDIITLGFNAPHAEPGGRVDGSPIVAGTFFMALEHPLAKVRVTEGDNGFRTACRLPREITLQPGESFTVSTVIGVAPEGQMRRAFNYYIERERAHPYRPFLHYNSWYDIAWHTKKMTEAECLGVVKEFGDALGPRNVHLDAFVFDDGWDDNASLWQFNDGFPNGFAPVLELAGQYGSDLGVWMSPWGGYSTAGNERLAYGREQGFEMYNGRFALSGPKYYARFRDVAKTMMTDYGVEYFKFDGVGDPGGGNVEALLKLTSELRAINPDLYINITIGTWPSPFWLWYGDSTWRDGSDTDRHGKGSNGQQWITYRDWQTYQNVVEPAPLYPLSSLMLHGVVFARNGGPEVTDKDPADLIAEIRSYFGSGTQLQELYITPSRMTAELWDALAEAVAWSHANADVLVDTHWIGGNPGNGDVYGWASWSPRKGILVLRNPDDAPQTITLDIAKVFDLPNGAPQTYTLKSPWKEDADNPTVEVTAGEEHTFELQPFQVLVFDALPTE